MLGRGFVFAVMTVSVSVLVVVVMASRWSLLCTAPAGEGAVCCARCGVRSASIGWTYGRDMNPDLCLGFLPALVEPTAETWTLICVWVFCQHWLNLRPRHEPENTAGLPWFLFWVSLFLWKANKLNTLRNLFSVSHTVVTLRWNFESFNRWWRIWGFIIIIIIIIIIVIIIIIIFINSSRVVTRWQWLFHMYTKHEIYY